MILHEKQLATDKQTYTHIVSVEVIYAKVHSGDKTRPHNNLETKLSTFKVILILSYHERRKLPKTQHTHAWHTRILAPIHSPRKPPDNKTSNYATITTHPSLGRWASKGYKTTCLTNTYLTPSENMYILYDALEIQDHRHINNQTACLVTQ